MPWTEISIDNLSGLNDFVSVQTGCSSYYKETFVNSDSLKNYYSQKAILGLQPRMFIYRDAFYDLNLFTDLTYNKDAMHLEILGVKRSPNVISAANKLVDQGTAILQEYGLTKIYARWCGSSADSGKTILMSTWATTCASVLSGRGWNDYSFVSHKSGCYTLNATLP